MVLFLNEAFTPWFLNGEWSQENREIIGPTAIDALDM